MCVAPLLQSQRLVSLTYFCLYLSWMAGSYEIITFLSVPSSCVRQASRLPNHQWAWAAKCRHITHFIMHTEFPQAATFIHIQGTAAHTHTHTLKHPLLSYSSCVRVLLGRRRRCKVNCGVFKSREATTRLSRHVCVCVFEVMWHFWADMKRHSAPSRLEGAPGERHWWRSGVSGGKFHGVNKKPCAAAEATCKTQAGLSSLYLLYAVRAKDMAHMHV